MVHEKALSPKEDPLIWNRFDKEYCFRFGKSMSGLVKSVPGLVKSMPERINAVKKIRGWATKY